MALTYRGGFANPTDGGSTTGSTITLNPASLPNAAVTGDIVVMVISGRRAAGSTASVTTDGGQAWSETEDFTSAPKAIAVYWCVFDGTWDASPVVTYTGTSSNNSGFMFVVQSSVAGTWSFDGEVAAANNATPSGPPFMGVCTGRTPGGQPSFTLAAFMMGTEATFGTAPAGWTSTEVAQYRNLAGVGNSMSFLYQIQDSTTDPTGNAEREMLTLESSYVNYTVTWLFTPSASASPGVYYRRRRSLTTGGRGL